MSLEERDELFDKWILRSWFNETIDEQAVKILFIQLFMGLYDELTENYSNKRRDDIFLNFINIVFPTVLDVYKWHESEKAKSDIGLINALSNIPVCDWYIELLSSYSQMYSSGKSKK